MKKQPNAVYIIENGGYTEQTYEEFRRREQICPLYADKLFLPLYGRLMEVSKEDYTEFYRAKRRQKYLDERSAENGDFSYDMLTTDEFSGEDILIAEQPDVCDAVVESIMTDKLRKAILKLTDEEQLLIYRHYTPVPTTIVAAITGRKTKAALPIHGAIMTSGLKTGFTVLLEQIRTIDKARLGEYIGRLDSKTLTAVDRAIVVSLGIKYLEGLLNG